MSERAKPYKKAIWLHLRKKVLEHDHYECQMCRRNYRDDGKKPIITRAVLVHHNFPVEKYPEYKYQMYVKLKNGETVRNLWSLCNECHEKCHPEHRINKSVAKNVPKFENDERFD